MPFLLAEILNFQGSTHLIGVGSLILLSKSWNISCRAVYETRTYGSMGGARFYSPSTLFMLCVILKLFTEKTDYSLPEGYIIMIIKKDYKHCCQGQYSGIWNIAVFFICGGLFSTYFEE